MKNIKYILLWLSILHSSSLYAQYDGGSGDGAYKSATIQNTLNGAMINTAGLYQGGSGDGHDKLILSTTISGGLLSMLFEGGDGDGHSKILILTSLGGEDLSKLYDGGIGDGHAKMQFSGSLEGITLNVLYFGGVGDGSSKDAFSGIVDGTNIDQMYTGGIGDGHDKEGIISLLNGEFLDQLFSGGIGDGFTKENFSGVVNGTSLAGLYEGGIGDGFAKQNIEYIFSFPGCNFVVNVDDDGFGSLRYAINCAMPGDTIEFSPLLLQDTIQLTSTPLMVSNDIYINGNKNANVFVDGSMLPRTFELDNGQTLTIKGLKIIIGSNPNGGGVLNNGFLTLMDVDILDPSGIASSVISTSLSGILRIKGEVKILEN